jgi:hypothetical protein
MLVLLSCLISLPFSSSWGLLGCDAMLCCGRIPMLQRSILPHQYPTTTLHGCTAQKTLTWIFTSVKTSISH